MFSESILSIENLSYRDRKKVADTCEILTIGTGLTALLSAALTSVVLAIVFLESLNSGLVNSAESVSKLEGASPMFTLIWLSGPSISLGLFLIVGSIEELVDPDSEEIGGR